MGRAEVFLHRTAMERATGDFTGLHCGQTVQRSCNFEGVQTNRFGGLESFQARTQTAAVVFRRTHQSLRREMLDLADRARTQTNCQGTRPDFRIRQNFGTWTNRLEFGPDALNARNVRAIRVSYDSVRGTRRLTRSNSRCYHNEYERDQLTGERFDDPYSKICCWSECTLTHLGKYRSEEQ